MSVAKTTGTRTLLFGKVVRIAKTRRVVTTKFRAKITIAITTTLHVASINARVGIVVADASDALLVGYEAIVVRVATIGLVEDIA